MSNVRMSDEEANSTFVILHSTFKCGAARKPNSVPPFDGGDHSSASRVTALVKQPTRRLIRKRAVPLPPYLVLLRRGFAMPSRSRGPRCALTAPFHPCLTPAFAVAIGGLFSVALSVASPRLAVSQPAARGSSDFPPHLTMRRSPSRSTVEE